MRAWFESDPSLGCVNRDGRDVRCSRANTPSFDIHYGNADGGPGQPNALAFISFLGDPSGNGESAVVAQFNQTPGGGYRLVKRIAAPPGDNVAPGTKVVFGQGRATWTTLVLQSGDSRSMPTGRKQVSLPLH